MSIRSDIITRLSRKTLFVLIILKLSYFGKSNFWKMKVLSIFGSWDQDTDSWFTNQDPLPTDILTYWPTNSNDFTELLFASYF